MTMEQVRELSSDDELRSISDEHRAAILRRLMAGPATISQMGRELGRHAAWVRHHVMSLEAAGLVKLDHVTTTRNYTEKYYAASAPAFVVHRLVRPESREGRPLMVLGSHDLAVDALADMTRSPSGADVMAAAAIGSLDGLIALRQGLADVAGCHLMDFASGEYNASYVRSLFPDRRTMLVTVAAREQGLLVAEGNPLGLRGLEDVMDPGVRFMNRNPGSGTHIWLEHQLRGMGHDPTVLGCTFASTHTEAANAVADNEADVSLGIRAAAVQAQVGFIPLFEERYDLVLDADRVDEPGIAQLLERIESRAFRRAVRLLAGYDSTETGRELRITT